MIIIPYHSVNFPCRKTKTCTQVSSHNQITMTNLHSLLASHVGPKTMSDLCSVYRETNSAKWLIMSVNLWLVMLLSISGSSTYALVREWGHIQLDVDLVERSFLESDGYHYVLLLVRSFGLRSTKSAKQELVGEWPITTSFSTLWRGFMYILVVLIHY